MCRLANERMLDDKKIGFSAEQVMAYEYAKSKITIALDVVRNLLMVSARMAKFSITPCLYPGHHK